MSGIFLGVGRVGLGGPWRGGCVGKRRLYSFTADSGFLGDRLLGALSWVAWSMVRGVDSRLAVVGDGYCIATKTGGISGIFLLGEENNSSLMVLNCGELIGYR